MLAPSRKLFYAVEAVLYIAYNATTKPISSKEIAEQQGLPPRYLEQIMQRLVHTGILRGVRGPHGGYLLARERRRITVGDICEVLMEEEDDHFGNYHATTLGEQIVKPLWQQVTETSMLALRHVSMADLCEQSTAQNIKKTAEERMDFTI